MTFSLSVLDSISVAGKAGRANEDRFGHGNGFAFVLDGATGLGDRQFMEGFGSDAAWMADFAAARLQTLMAADCDVRTVIRGIITEARDAFRAVAGDQPRHAWPLCALSMLRATPEGLQFLGYGDSAVYLLEDDATEGHVLIPILGAYDNEQAAARRHVERNGGIGAAGIATGDPVTMEGLRQARARQNTPGGPIWTFGMVPEAADHLLIEPVEITGPATAIVCSDGLADLVALYRAYDPAGLVRAAGDKGLASLVDELRHFERKIDPDGLQYPRYKQSDDTTALLVRIERS
ncbi:protein phosphatase 2C domain-containing protein [Rhizobium halophytocola]|uniref:Protein phosphatase 2C domain-containing protein n=1 Tax=Rhizobium halophytocola TaxID=735519 RepID=A0ABS4E390_9HYPH|nr:protein phosphatase 2C domain-containing protein [Rhizobium halophytocola]MBP1852400.1 hypothetical protein [Rhizobium halophytocola]